GCFVLECLAGPASGGVSRRSLFFEPYEGQFVTRTKSHSVHIGPTSATFSDRISSIRVNMAGANVHAEPGTLQKLPATVNYFTGSDPRKWRRGVPTYGRITYKDVYPGIDITYYGKDGELEFDFVVGPNGLPGRIHLSFDGAERLEIDEAGGLEIHAAGSMLSIHRPVAYQIVDKAMRYVETGFDLIGQSEAVVHVDKYDSQFPLIIDPLLVYSTYLGGSQRDAPARIAVDGQGNAYSTGQTFSIDFLAKSPMQLLRGSSDAFVTKVDPDGNLVYSTFIGGDADDEAKAISIDTRGNVYLAGSTFSQNFPVGPAITQYGGLGDGFIVRLDTSGSLT